MSKFEIHIPAKKKVFANPDDWPVIRISPSAYNALIEIGNESTACHELAKRVRKVLF